MSDLLPFLVIGITTGSVYGLAAMGLVLTYKTSGIFNFAHGAIASLAAYAYYDLNALHGVPAPWALLIAVVALPPVVALVMERVTAALAGASTASKVVATVGLQLAVTGALIAHYGASALAFPGFLPTDTVKLVGVYVGIDQLVSAGVAAAAALGFFAFFRLSSTGVKMRAVVDDPALLALAGTSVFSVRGWAWLVGCWFAALSGVLLAPLLGLDALLLTLLVVQAYGAAAVGFFSSLPMTYAGGLLIGILAALSTGVFSGSVLAELPPALPFLVLLVVLLVAGRSRLVEIGVQRSVPPSPPLVGRRVAHAVAAAAIVVGVAVPFVVGPKLPVYATALVFVPIFSSLYLLVRTSGQVSLAHAALVAVGASAFSHLTVGGAGLPWLIGVLVAGLVTAPVGALVAIPAIRLSGVYLALATFGFGLLMEKVGYRTEAMFGADSTLPAARPALLDSDRAFYFVLLAFAVAGSLLIALIGRSRLGRLLRAMADAPTTLSTLGLGVNVTRVTVFAVSAFMAGVAGALYAAQGQSATGAPLVSYASLTWLATLVLCSGLRSAAPVAAAIGLVVVPAYVTNETVVAWLPVGFGLGALLVALGEARTAGRPRTGAMQRGMAGPAGSRAAARIGSSGVFVERARTARAASTAHPQPGPARVRFGVGQVPGASR